MGCGENLKRKIVAAVRTQPAAREATAKAIIQIKMHSSLFVALAALLPSVAAAGTCNADNCLRAIRATKRPGLKDCNQYLEKTVTPDAVTVTTVETQTQTVTPTVYISVTDSRLVLVTATQTQLVTQTSFVTVTQTVNSIFNKRQQTAAPLAVPLYASACSGAVRYSSACSCLGASEATVTAEAPTVTATAFTTVTVSPITVSIPTTVTTVEVTTIASTQTVTETVLESATATAQVPLPIPPQCVDLSARNKLHTFGAPNRNIDTKPGGSWVGPDTEEYRSLCCATCYATTDCSVFL
jgi:hypothetical protein